MPNQNLLWFLLRSFSAVQFSWSISESGECSEIKQYITFFDQMPEAIGE